MTNTELAAALKRRQQLNRRNLKRYVHTGSFNRLAGRSTAPGTMRPETAQAVSRIMFSILAAAFSASDSASSFFRHPVRGI